MNKKQAIQDFLNLDLFNIEHTEEQEQEKMLSEIRVFGEIWEGSLYDFDESLQDIGSNSVEILINSPGGSVFDGVAMAAMVKRLNNQTTATGIGFVASIASVLLLSADNVRLNRDAFLMIHNAWSFEAGEAKEMRKTARILDKISDQIANVYVAQIEKAGKLVDGDKDKTKERVKSLMDKETWFTAQEALDFGLIDEIADGQKEEIEPTEEEIELIFNKYSATAPTQFLNKFKNIEQMSDNNQKAVSEESSLWNKIVDFFKGSPNKVEDLQQELKAQQDAEIQKAIEIAKENGFYKEPVEETTEEISASVEEAPVVENKVEEPAEETTEEVVEENAEILALKAQNEALQAQMKAIEEKLGSPSAGDGPKAENSTIKNNEQMFAPNKEAKDFLNGFSKLFQ